MTSIEKKNYQRKFYQILMTLAFFLDTSQYRCISRIVMQFYIFDWIILVSNNIIVLRHINFYQYIFDIIKRLHNRDSERSDECMNIIMTFFLN